MSPRARRLTDVHPASKATLRIQYMDGGGVISGFVLVAPWGVLFPSYALSTATSLCVVRDGSGTCSGALAGACLHTDIASELLVDERWALVVRAVAETWRVEHRSDPPGLCFRLPTGNVRLVRLADRLFYADERGTQITREPMLIDAEAELPGAGTLPRAYFSLAALSPLAAALPAVLVAERAAVIERMPYPFSLVPNTAFDEADMGLPALHISQVQGPGIPYPGVQQLMLHISTASTGTLRLFDLTRDLCMVCRPSASDCAHRELRDFSRALAQKPLR